MCVRCGTGRIAWCTSPDRHGDGDYDPAPVDGGVSDPYRPGDYGETVYTETNCACKGRRQGRHDLLCEEILRDVFGEVGNADRDILALMRDKGRIVEGTVVPPGIEPVPGG